MDDYPALAMYVDGEWLGTEGRRTHSVVNPATGQVLAQLPLADAADLDRALDAAARGFTTWRHTPVEERARVLKTAAALLRERAEHVARVATTEQGKTIHETRIEVHMAAGALEWAGEEARRLYGRVLVRPTGMRSIVVKEPVGPVAAFAPWNFPIGNPGRKLSSALGAGCSVVLKPPEEAPASALEVLRALLDAGLPPGVAQVVFGVPDEVSRHLLASPVIRKMSFTGSTAVGKHLLKLCADGMKRTTLELGGHAPVVVFDDVDVDKVLDAVVPAKFRNAGQVCVSPTRFYVQRGIYDEFVEGFTRRAAQLPVGNGLDEANRMGPMANPRRVEAMGRFIEDAESHGAKRTTGGDRLGADGFFWEPTVLADVPLAARVMNEEPFGPLALMAPFDTFDDAVQNANRLPYALAAYAYTDSAKRAMLIGDALEAGMVGINTERMGAADAPFGGVKESGHGAEDGPEGIEACLVTKAIHQS
jgi:succinate-semialdehyde dehydrogenase/glutarate-semialdehyde dehydrogenase